MAAVTQKDSRTDLRGGQFNVRPVRPRMVAVFAVAGKSNSNWPTSASITPLFATIHSVTQRPRVTDCFEPHSNSNDSLAAT